VLLTVLGQSSVEIKAAVLAGPSRVLKCIEGWVNEVIEASIVNAPGDAGGVGSGSGGGAGAEASQALLLSVLDCLDTLPMDLATLKRTGIGRVAGSLRKPLTGGVSGGGGGGSGGGSGGQGQGDVSAKAKQLVEKWRLLAEPGAGAGTGGVSGSAAAAASASKKARTGPGSSLVIDVASGGSSGEGDCGSGQ